MSLVDKYYTIKEPSFSELKIKGSVFIAGIYPVNNSNQAIEILKNVRTKHYDANHNCFAYKINFDGSEFRYSDDGEPSGTAGKPIYYMINKYDLSDVILIVTRYFGGTKLGVGGLVRAYSDSAEEVLKTTEKLAINITKTFLIECSYNEINIVKKIVEKSAVEFKEEYTDIICFIAKIPLSKCEEFPKIIYNSTNGKVSASEI